MGDRIKVLSLLALMGFTLGVVAHFIYLWIVLSLQFSLYYIGIPRIPAWFLTGIAGAVLTVLSAVVWVYLTTRKEEIR